MYKATDIMTSPTKSVQGTISSSVDTIGESPFVGDDKKSDAVDLRYKHKQTASTENRLNAKPLDRNLIIPHNTELKELRISIGPLSPPLPERLVIEEPIYASQAKKEIQNLDYGPKISTGKKRGRKPKNPEKKEAHITFSKKSRPCLKVLDVDKKFSDKNIEREYVASRPENNSNMGRIITIEKDIAQPSLHGIDNSFGSEGDYVVSRPEDDPNNGEDSTVDEHHSPSQGVDNSLGNALATSLQLIATGGSSPPPSDSVLNPSYSGENTDFASERHLYDQSYTQDMDEYSRDAQVNDSLLEQSFSKDNTNHNTRSPHSPGPIPNSIGASSSIAKNVERNVSPPPMKKRGRKKKIKIEDILESEEHMSDTEIMKPILHNDGSVTLFQCEVCYKLFHKRQTLRQHFITHTDRFACEFCDARCKSKGDLRTHIQTHTKEKPYHCDVCNTNYTRESILRKHLKTQLHLRAVHESDSIDQNKKSSGRNKGMERFIASKTKVQLAGFSCQKCSKVLLTKLEYRKHLKSHAMTHICNICQKGCKTALLLKVHAKSHTTESKLSCRSCSRKFSSLQALKDHIKNHRLLSEPKHPDPSLIKAVIHKHNKDIKMLKLSAEGKSVDVKPRAKQGRVRKASFECNICHRLFTSEKRLSNHFDTHKGNFTCKVCTKSFPSVLKLTNHMLDHEKEAIRCEICHAPFTGQDELNEHVESMHCEGSELVCKICYKKFEEPSEVHKHMNEHAPTMLFSGGSLDESSIPVVNRGRRSFHSGYLKVSDSEYSSDDEKKHVSIYVGSSHTKKGVKESGDDGGLNNADFIEVLQTALQTDDIEGGCEDTFEVEDDIFSGIIEVIENEVHSSAESDIDDDFEEDDNSSVSEKPILYCHGDIVRKHGEEFEQYSFKEPSKNLFQCTLCEISYEKEKFLYDHLKSHVCEYCNKFFLDMTKLSVHKTSHVKRLLIKIDNETKRMQHPKQKWKSHHLLSSDSELDNEDNFLNELEDILENDSFKGNRSTNFLRTLSHDDIVKVNKPIFDEHSFVDITNNIFACTICKRKYARPTTLTRHFKTHVCQYCNTFFIDKSDLLEHKYRHRKRAALMKAEITGEGSKMPPSPVVSKENRALFKRFSYVDPERNINRCTLCSKDFVRRTVLTRHLKTHICGHCDKFFEDKYDLVKHTTFHKVDKHYAEEDGDDEGEDFMDFDEEAKNYTQAAPLPLSLRKKSLNLPQSFSSSLATYTSPFHTQSSCNSRSEPITYIQLPNRTNGEPESAQVFPTQTTGTSSYQLISQPVNMYKENNTDTYLVSTSNCPPNEQDKLITLTQPQMVHTDSEERERLFECGECGKRFYKNGHLKSHMTIHTGSRPYVCGVCGKAFGRGTTLRKHEKTHMKKCKICDTTFGSKYELDLHLEIHRTYAFYK